jgi:hypothetical protein
MDDLPPIVFTIMDVACMAFSVGYLGECGSASTAAHAGIVAAATSRRKAPAYSRSSTFMCRRVVLMFAWPTSPTIATPIHRGRGSRIAKRRGAGVMGSGADMPSGYRGRGGG